MKFLKKYELLNESIGEKTHLNKIHFFISKDGKYIMIKEGGENYGNMDKFYYFGVHDIKDFNNNSDVFKIESEYDMGDGRWERWNDDPIYKDYKERDIYLLDVNQSIRNLTRPDRDAKLLDIKLEDFKPVIGEITLNIIK